MTADRSTTSELRTTPSHQLVGAQARVNPDEISPVDLAVMLSLLPATHVLVAAARAGLAVGALREDVPLGLDDYAGGRHHRAHELEEYGELQRRRWPPTGDRDLWVRNGPAGPPCTAVESSEAAA